MFAVAKDQGKHQLTQTVQRISKADPQKKKKKSSTDNQREIQEKLNVT